MTDETCDCGGTGRFECEYCDEDGNVFSPDTYMRPMVCGECHGLGWHVCEDCNDEVPT